MRRWRERIRNPLRRSSSQLGAGAPGHPLPAAPRPPARPPVPGAVLRGAPGRPLSNGPAVNRLVGRDAVAGGPAWELVALAVALAAVGRIADGPGLWVAAFLAGIALAFGALEVLGQAEPPDGAADLGIPVEATLLAGVAGVAGVTGLHLVPVGLFLVPGLIAVGALVASAIDIERRILARRSGPTAADRTALLSLIVVLAILAFAGIAAAIPGALVEPPPIDLELPLPGLPLEGLALLAVLDGIVAGALGYRLAALRATTVRSALQIALSYAAVVAISAAVIRAVGLPRLLGPALLTLVLYLWSAYQGAPRGGRRDVRWLWEMLLLGALGALVVVWNLLFQE